MKRIVATVVALAMLACAAVALGAVPKRGLYTGSTSQDMPVRIRINKHHNISDGGFKIDWVADHCDHGKGWTDHTETFGTLDVKEDGSFSRSGKYNNTIGDYTGHISVTAKGVFDTKTSATGTFHVKVRVSKNGDTVDHCHRTVSWSVSD